MFISFVALFALYIGSFFLDLNSERMNTFDWRGDVYAANIGMYHQGAVRHVSASGGSAFSGAVPNASALAQLPSWFGKTADWQSAANAGVVATCLTTIPVNVSVNKVVARLATRSFNDPGAGAAVSGQFRTVSTLTTTLNGQALPLACANGSPTYVSRVN